MDQRTKLENIFFSRNYINATHNGDNLRVMPTYLTNCQNLELVRSLEKVSLHMDQRTQLRKRLFFRDHTNAPGKSDSICGVSMHSFDCHQFAGWQTSRTIVNVCFRRLCVRMICMKKVVVAVR